MNREIADKRHQNEQGKQWADLRFKGNPNGQIKSGICGLGPKQEQSGVISKGVLASAPLLKDQELTSIHPYTEFSNPSLIRPVQLWLLSSIYMLVCHANVHKEESFSKRTCTVHFINLPSACYLPPTSQGCMPVQSTTAIYIFLTSLLAYNFLTTLCQFLLYNKVNQLYIYIHPHIFSLLRLPLPLPIPPLQVVTKQGADLLVP